MAVFAAVEGSVAGAGAWACGLRAGAREAVPRPRDEAAELGPLGLERSRLQLLLKLAGTLTSVLDFWLGNVGCASVFKDV